MKMRRRSRGASLAWLLAGCFALPGVLQAQVRPGSVAKNRSGWTLLRLGVHVLGASSLEELSNISSDGATLVFVGRTPELDKIAGGDVIVAGVSPQTPEGFLRRVLWLSESEGTLVLETEPATLEDVFWFGGARENVVMYAPDVATTTVYAKGVRVVEVPGVEPPETLDAWSPGAIEVDFLEVVLYDEDRDLSTTDDQVRATGRVGMKPAFDIDLRVSWGRVRRFSFTSTNELYTGLELDARVPVVELSRSKTVASLEFAPVVIPVGPVPLVFTPVVDIRVGVFGDVTAEARSAVYAGVHTAAGVVYERRRWRAYGSLPRGLEDVDLWWEVPQPFELSGEVQVYAGARSSVLLFGVAGPFAELYGSW